MCVLLFGGVGGVGVGCFGFPPSSDPVEASDLKRQYLGMALPNKMDGQTKDVI